jgi:DnaK suppressor protein
MRSLFDQLHRKVKIMDSEQLEFFHTILTHWLAELHRLANDTVTGLKDSQVLPDPLDRASFESTREFQLRIRDRESVLIKKIKQSLEDIKYGTYGICEMCDQDISIARLKARPVARHCIRCKTIMEQMEKKTGT